MRNELPIQASASRNRDDAVVAIVQMRAIPGARQSNRERSLTLARQAFSEGAAIVVLPELCIQGYDTSRPELYEDAESIEGETVDQWIGLAGEFDGCIVGGLAERSNGRTYNAAVAVDGSQMLLHYRKLHLFGKEKQIFTPGDLGLPVAATRFGTLGLCVCYDLRFIEVIRVLSLQGADLICVPTAWVAGYDAPDIDTDGHIPQVQNVIVQANLNQVFIACASLAHHDSSSTDLMGSSVLVDPYGRILQGPLTHDRDEIALGSFSTGDVEAAMERTATIRPREDRRSDVYRVLINGNAL